MGAMIYCCWMMWLQPQRFYQHYQEGLELIQREEYAEAVEALKRAVELKPESSPNAKLYGVQLVEYFPYRNLTYACLIMGDVEGARRYLNLARKYQEDRDDRIRFDLNLFENSITQLEPSPEEPPPPDIDYGAILDLCASGQFEDARSLVRDLLEVYPDTPSLEVIGMLVETLGVNQSKLSEIQKQQDRKLSEMRRQARVMRDQGQLEEAYVQYRLVLALDPGDDEAMRYVKQYRASLVRDDEAAESKLEGLEERLRQRESDLAHTFDSFQALQEEKEVLGQRNKALTQQLKSYQRSQPAVTPLVSVNWVIERIADMTYSIAASIESNVNLKEAALWVNGKEIQRFELRGRKRYRVPGGDFVFSLFDNELELKVIDYHENVHEKRYLHRIPEPEPLAQRLVVRVAFLITMLLGVLWFVGRQRRQRRAFRERFNPYIAGAPVLNEQMFYGRHDLLRQILNTLHNNSLMVYGERRIGKTSFLHRLHAVLPTIEDPVFRFFPVFLDLQGVTEEDFFGFLDSEICAAMESWGLEASPFSGRLDGRGFTQRIRMHIKSLKEHSDRDPKLVLLLDEVDVMNGFSEKTNQQLRSVFMKGFARHLVAVMAGIHISKRWKSEGSPWYNFFEQIELKPFPEAHAEALITNPVRHVYSYDRKAVKRILERTGGKPYLIQKMCVNLVAHVLNENKRHIQVQDVEFVYREIQHEFKGHLT